MHELLLFSLTVFTGFFAIMNPIANTPIFMSLVGDSDEKEQKVIARKAVITAFIITTSFIVLGQYIFNLFGLSISAFKISGGLLIFYVGFEMVQAKISKVSSQSHIAIDEGIAISPLAIPLLAGPGTIVTAMNYTINSNLIHTIIVISTFSLMILLTYLAFIYSEKLVKIVGQNLIVVLGKLMGVILTVIGTGMAIDGIKLAFGLGT